MALPTQKRTRASKKNRAVHYRIKNITLSKCSNCEKPVKPHHACSECGYYAGRKIIEVKK